MTMELHFMGLSEPRSILMNENGAFIRTTMSGLNIVFMATNGFHRRHLRLRYVPGQ
jgi:hypothetical protein